MGAGVKVREPAQVAARLRNWQIFRLRGLWSLTFLLTDWRRTQAQALVDDELALLGAERQTDRMRREDAARDLKYQQDCEQELPF